jgi:hypothetical protein
MSLPLAAASLTAILAVASAAMLPAVGAGTPAPAIAFGGLTTIYVGSGVYDNGGAAFAGIATSVHCTNVSGEPATFRVAFLSNAGVVVKSSSPVTMLHGVSLTVSTHATAYDQEASFTGAIQGSVNIEATQSGVFCTGAVIDALNPNEGFALNLVRVNPHPGTAE